VERVEGIMAHAQGDSIELRVLRTRSRSGDWTDWRGESVTFGVDDFATAGQRRFSRGRTAVAIGAVTAVLIAVITTDLFGIGGRLSGNDPRPIPPVNPG
jgi:hypothetical protein